VLLAANAAFVEALIAQHLGYAPPWRSSRQSFYAATQS
jgi:hypothetical protein